MNSEELKNRFKEFAYRTVKVCESLSPTTTNHLPESLKDLKFFPADKLTLLIDESIELTKILSASKTR